jgi:hypothetical protein
MRAKSHSIGLSKSRRRSAPDAMRARFSERRPMSQSGAENLSAEIDSIAALNIDELRALWRETMGRPAPNALSKDLIARALAYRLQEQSLGGLDPHLRRLLMSQLKPGAEPVRRLKIGSVIVREYEGKVHEVMVAPGGFCWSGQTYSSLSAIARKITGTSWNGPRFFGLRGKDKPPAEQEVKSTGLRGDERRPSGGAVRPRFKRASADGVAGDRG